MLSPTSYPRATERKHPWPMVRLGDVCEILTDGDWIESKDQAKSGIRLIHTENIGVGEYLDKANRSKFISDSTFERLKCTEIYPGDVLVSRLPEPVGRSCVLPLLNQRMITAVDCSIVRFKSFILPEFFVAYSQTFQYETQILSYLTGSTRQRISRGNLAKIEIPLPPLSVQREIVARLERELAAVEKMKKGFEELAETAKAEFKAELKEVFEELKHRGTETRRLGEVCEPITDGDHQPPPKTLQGVPFLVISNVATGRISFGNTRFVPRAYYEAIQENRKPRKGDVLLTVTGSYGIPVLVDTNEIFCFQRHIALLRASRLDSQFLVYALLSPESKRYFDLVATGAAQKTIGLASIRAMSIPFPSVPVQREVVARLDVAKAKAEKLEAKAREGVAVCETMRKAILKEAFDFGRKG